MGEFSNKTVCFVDNGLFGAFARRVGKEFKKAYYTIRTVSAFPSAKRVELWSGFPELTVINDPLEVIDEVDLWVFLDVFSGELQKFLVERGARVWGARSAQAEDMELQRWDFKALLREVWLPVGECELIVGTKDLRKFLETRENWYVKGDSGWTRGDMETWKWKNKHISSGRLAEVEYDLGEGVRDEFRFIVEREIPDAIEIAGDGWSIDGLFPSPCLQGVEVKGLGLLAICKPYDSLTPAVRMVNAALAPTLARWKYRGFFCAEMRKTAASAPFVLDPCCRLGSPSNELLQTMLGGWSRIFWDGAEGAIAAPKQLARYGMVAMVYSEQSDKITQPLAYPHALDEWVILRNGFRKGGKNYSLSQGSKANVAGVVGVGNTILEAVNKCAEHAKQVNGQGVEISLDAVGKSLDIIADGSKYGVKFTDDRLPTAAELKKAVE